MKKLIRRSDCPLSCWLELFGDKWSLLIIRDIVLFEKKNYKDFVSSNEGISTNILADRLKSLVEIGILSKTIDEKNKLLINYEITEKGMELSLIFKEIGKWSNKYLPNTRNVENLKS